MSHTDCQSDPYRLTLQIFNLLYEEKKKARNKEEVKNNKVNFFKIC